MVSKSRLAGFIDAIVAVVMTIMLLEFKSNDTGSVSEFLRENLVYLIAYLLSFIYVTTSWFNQQYMLKQAERITRQIYISCMIWVLSLSLLPVLAAWTGRTINLFDHLGLNSPKAPALLFLFMIYLWGIAYANMSRAFIKDNPGERGELLISKMEVYNYLRRPIWTITILIAALATYFYPPFVFIYTSWEMGYTIVRSRNWETVIREEKGLVAEVEKEVKKLTDKF